MHRVAWALRGVRRALVDIGTCVLQVDGLTPLMFASFGGHVECARLLLDRGAGVDAPKVSSWLIARTLVLHGLCGVCGERLWTLVCALLCGKATCCVYEDVAVVGMVVC
jgi:hypothetical protein